MHPCIAFVDAVHRLCRFGKVAATYCDDGEDAVPQRPVPTVRQRRLGAELRKMREHAGMGATSAAERLGADAVTSRKSTKGASTQGWARRVPPSGWARTARGSATWRPVASG